MTKSATESKAKPISIMKRPSTSLNVLVNMPKSGNELAEPQNVAFSAETEVKEITKQAIAKSLERLS